MGESGRQTQPFGYILGWESLPIKSCGYKPTPLPIQFFHLEIFYADLSTLKSESDFNPIRLLSFFSTL